MKKAFLLFAVLAAVAGCSDAQSQGDVQYETWSWTAPTTGSPAWRYHFERTIAVGTDTIVDVHDAVADTFLTVVKVSPAYVRARVFAYDELLREGPWSEWSVWYYNAGPPDKPGAPVRTID